MHNNANMAAKFLPKLSKSQQNVAWQNISTFVSNKNGELHLKFLFTDLLDCKQTSEVDF